MRTKFKVNKKNKRTGSINKFNAMDIMFVFSINVFVCTFLIFIIKKYNIYSVCPFRPIIYTKRLQPIYLNAHLFIFLRIRAQRYGIKMRTSISYTTTTLLLFFFFIISLHIIIMFNYVCYSLPTYKCNYNVLVIFIFFGRCV